MQQPDLYRQWNAMVRFEAERIYKNSVLKWRSDNRDSLLDVGCGPGDVLMDFVYPLMPRGFEKCIGTDISPQMIEYAREYYKDYKGCDFEILDISTDKSLPSHLAGQFDHVTSCYCLQWVQKLRQAFENIYNLLRPQGGDCLLLFPVSIYYYDVYMELRKSPKWSLFIGDVNSLITPLHHMEDPKKFMETSLHEIGFNGIQVEVRNKCYTYKDFNAFKGLTKIVCPIFERVPTQLHSELMDDFLNVIKSMNLWHDNGLNTEIAAPHKLMVVYAKKNPSPT